MITVYESIVVDLSSTRGVSDPFRPRRHRNSIINQHARRLTAAWTWQWHGILHVRCCIRIGTVAIPSVASPLLFSSLSWGDRLGNKHRPCLVLVFIIISEYQTEKAKGKQTERARDEPLGTGHGGGSACGRGGGGGARKGTDQATVKRARMVHSARVQWALLSRSRKSSEGRKGPCNGSDLHAASTEWRVDVAGVDHANEELRGPGFVPLTFSAMEGNSTVCLPELSSPQRHKLYEQIQRLSFPVSLFFLYNSQNCLNYLSMHRLEAILKWLWYFFKIGKNMVGT